MSSAANKPGDGLTTEALTGEYRADDSQGEATGEFTEELGTSPPRARVASDVTGEYRPGELDEAAGGSAGGATGEYRPDDRQAGRLGDATGEYRPDDRAGDATGEYRADDRQDDRPGDATGAFQPEQDERAGDATGAYQPEKPDKAGEATGDFRPEGESRAGATGIKGRLGEITGAASVGAFPPAEPAMRTGRYYLKNVAGKGGMGEVWLAEDSDIGRPVALKRMLQGASPEFKERFLLEAQITGQLEHPGVVPVHELGLDEAHQPYYVMKFVQGKTLKAAIAEYHDKDKPQQTPREVQQLQLLNIFIDLCQTVAYAHSRGVIHRDLKPDNVMVGSYGETIVLDWGLAKVIGEPESADPFAKVQPSAWDESLATMAGSIKGTPSYMAPEVAEGDVTAVDQSSDVYLLGGCLYQILTGQTPRKANKVKELIRLAKTTPPTPPRKIDPTISRPLDAICVKALAMQKADRYSSASALAEDVQRYLAGEPVSAYRETFLERSWRWIKKHRKVLGRAAAAVVFATVVIAAVVLIRQAQLDREEALRKSAELESQAQARRDLIQFRRLADETNFYAANSDPMEESAPFFDPKKGEAKGQEALTLAAKWGPKVDDLPLEEERAGVRLELFNLLLLLAEVKNRYGDPAQAQETLALLDRAAEMGPGTSSFYRLRGACYRLLKDDSKAKENEVRAQNTGAQMTAMDHFLLAEQYRHESSRTAQLPPLVTGKGGKEARTRNWEVQKEILDKAIPEYRLAQAIDPVHYWSHYQLGRCYLALGKESEAVEAFTTCVALRPDTLWGYAERGFALGQLGKFREALADLDKAVALDPEFRPVRLNRGIVYGKQKKYDEALKDLKEVLEPPADKQLLQAAFFRGQMQMDRGRKYYAAALADFNRVAEAKGQVHPALYLYRARVYLVEGNEEQLLKNLKAYLAAGAHADPESRKVAEQIGRELRVLATELPSEAHSLLEKTYLLALTQIDKAIADGASAALYGERGALEEVLLPLRPRQEISKHIRNALTAYSKALDIDAKNVRVLVKRGWLLNSIRQLPKARDDFASALEVDPADAEAHTGLGYVQACLKVSDDANRHAAQAVLYRPGDHLVLHNVACIYAKLAQAEPAKTRAYQDMALDQLKRAVELWVKGGRNPGLNAINLIRTEEAFDAALRARPEFVQLIKGKE